MRKASDASSPGVRYRSQGRLRSAGVSRIRTEYAALNHGSLYGVVTDLSTFQLSMNLFPHSKCAIVTHLFVITVTGSDMAIKNRV